MFLTTTFLGYSQGQIDGFYKQQHEGTLVLGAGFEDTKNYYVGSQRTDISRSLYYGNIFAAYGILENLNAQVAIPFLSSNDNTNFQDISVFIKYRFGKVVFEKSVLEFSAAAGFSTPLTNYDVGGLNDIGQQATTLQSRLMLHYQVDSGWFGTLQSGYNYKFDEVPNAFPLTLKVGKAAADYYYDIYYDYQNSENGIDYLGTPRPQNFKEFEVDFHKVGGTFFKPFNPNWGMYVSLGYVVSGRNVFQGPSYGLGLVYDFKKN